MSCAFTLWSGVVSSKSGKWTWWVELLPPQMGFLGCRQKLWSCTDKPSFSDACPLSLHVIWFLPTHPSPVNQHFVLIAAAACVKAHRWDGFHVWGRNVLPHQADIPFTHRLIRGWVRASSWAKTHDFKERNLKKETLWEHWENMQPSLRNTPFIICGKDRIHTW